MKYSKAKTLLETLSPDEIQDEFYSIHTHAGQILPEPDPAVNLLSACCNWASIRDTIAHYSTIDDTSITLPSGRILKPQREDDGGKPNCEHCTSSYANWIGWRPRPHHWCSVIHAKVNPEHPSCVFSPILKPQEATQYPAPVVTHPVFKAPRISVTFKSRQVAPDVFTFRFSGTVFDETFENRGTSYPFFRSRCVAIIAKDQEHEKQTLESLAWSDLNLSENLSPAGRKALAPALAAIYKELL